MTVCSILDVYFAYSADSTLRIMLDKQLMAAIISIHLEYILCIWCGLNFVHNADQTARCAYHQLSSCCFAQIQPQIASEQRQFSHHLHITRNSLRRFAQFLYHFTNPVLISIYCEFYPFLFLHLKLSFFVDISFYDWK